MPLEFIDYKGAKYQIITANKAHEPAYRKINTGKIQQKYGQIIPRKHMIAALQDVFDFYASEIEKEIHGIDDASFFVFVYILHEETAILSYKNQDDYELTVDYHYFVLYRRILKMILHESCLLDLKSAKGVPDRKWMDETVFMIEKLVYLGHCMFDQAEAISEEKITNGSIDIIFKNDLITFANTKDWDNFLPSLSQHFVTDIRNSIIDTNLQSDFNKRIKPELGLDLKDIANILASLNNLLHNQDPPKLCTLPEFMDVLKTKTQSPYIEPFISGLILNRDYVTSVKAAATSPYTGKRIIHKPILTLMIDNAPCLLINEFSFSEAMNTFFQNNITLGKIPQEWESIKFLIEIRNDYKNHNKDILENPVEELLKKEKVQYVRNIKTLFAKNNKHLSINKTPGEIDFIFLFKNRVFIAECKNLTKRYEMHGYYQDIAKFTSEYNAKMEEKLAFLNNNKLKLQEHLQIEFKKSELDINNFKIEGIFIINTPTYYLLNSRYKIYTFHRLALFLKGDDFFSKFIAWPQSTQKYKIGWPFVDNLRKVLTQSTNQ